MKRLCEYLTRDRHCWIDTAAFMCVPFIGPVFELASWGRFMWLAGAWMFLTAICRGLAR